MRVARKHIIVPNDKEAEAALDYDEAKDEQVIRLTLNDEDFLFLWKAGIFELINDVANANIDDFESEEITDTANIQKVITALISRSLFADERLKLHLQKITDLFEEALRRKVGIYIFF